MLAILLTSQVFAVSVDFYDEQQSNTSITGVKLRINNDSGSPIRDAKLRYYFHKPSSAYAVDKHYLADASISVNDVNEDLAYFELRIPSVSVGYYPSMDGFSVSLHNGNWSSWDKSKDYSYQAFSTFKKNTKVVLLSGNDVVFGTAPDVQSASEPENVKISGLKFSENSWLELKNVGKSTVDMSNFQLVDANNSAFSINNSLESGEILRICQHQIACGNISKSHVLPNFRWGDDGEAFIKRGDSIVSYVAWGQPGVHAEDAVNAGVWTDAQTFLPAESQIQRFNANYTNNVFFRLKLNKSGVNTGDWFSFTSNDNPAEFEPIPLPIKTSANNPVIQQIPGDNEVLFSWLPVQGVNSYRVIVRDQNNNDIYNLSTSNTSVSLVLAPDQQYSWTVIGDDKFSTEHKKSESDMSYKNIFIQLANIDTTIFKQLKIHHIKGRRDTRMLDLAYLQFSYEYSWDRPNLDAPTIEPHEDVRCWAIATQVMNHFYGGNLTQDEIVYHGHYIANEPLLSPFRPEGGNDKTYGSTVIIDPVTRDPINEISETLKWALHVERLNYGKGMPSYATVKNAIDNNKLIYLLVPGHAMLIYGYVGDATKYAFYYAFSDNEGNTETSLTYNAQVQSYFIPDVTYGNVEMSNSLVHSDSDGDGITDFEEETRFGTDVFYIDTDNDGIEDKREIYNCMMNAYSGGKNKRGGVYTTNKDLDYDLFRIRNVCDKDKDSVLSILDSDDDGDGVEDGLKGKDDVIDMDVPEDYTIFGREYVRINDRVKCYNTQIKSDSYCNIASSDENIFSYDISYAPVNIGVRAHVGNVDVRSDDFPKSRYDSAYWYPGQHLNPILRNSSVIHGNVNLYAVPYNDSISAMKSKGYSIPEAKEIYFKTLNPLNYFSKQDGATVKGRISLALIMDWKRNFTYKYSMNMPKISGTKNKIVQSGETYHLKDGDSFSTLRVEAGGTLIIEPGEMFVDSVLQIEANSTVRFAEPGKGTVLHTNGKIIWRTYNGEPATNNQYWAAVARGFKLAHHSSRAFHIEGLWAGTIFAPKAKVVMGQVNKTIYGRILGRDVIVHQNSNVYRVDFDPTDASQVAYAF